MEKPHLWVGLMVIISIISFSGNSSVTVFTGGLLSIPTAVAVSIFVTSIPIILLIWLDSRGLKKRGIDVGARRFLFYLLAIPLPSYFMTPLYVIARPRESSATNSEPDFATVAIQGLDQEYNELSESSLSSSELENMVDAEYEDAINEMLRQDFEDEGAEEADYQLHTSDDGTSFFVASEDGMEVMALGLRPNNGDEDGLESAAERISDFTSQLDTNPEMAFVFTDVPINEDLQHRILTESGILFADQSVTRRALSTYNIA